MSLAPQAGSAIFATPNGNWLYARKRFDDATWRLDNARHELAQKGVLSQLTRRGRHDKASLLERIDHFEHDLLDAQGAVTRCETSVDDRRQEFAREITWDIKHGWRNERLRVIDAEVGEIRRDQPTPENPLPARREQDAPLRNRGIARQASNLRTPDWIQRITEIAPPPLPGRDTGQGLDIGL